MSKKGKDDEVQLVLFMSIVASVSTGIAISSVGASVAAFFWFWTTVFVVENWVNK